MLAARQIRDFKPSEFPRGRKMLEPVVVLGFCCIASTLALTVIIQAIETLVSKEYSNVALDTAVITLFVFSACVNGSFFVYCWRIAIQTRSEAVRSNVFTCPPLSDDNDRVLVVSAQVKALALDFRNDSLSFVMAVSLCLCPPC
jgi:hypothetical protein